MEGTRAQPRTVLVVDDAPEMRRFLGAALAGEAGFRLLVAPDGKAALVTAMAERVDLVLLDLVMPGMDGLEVCRALKTLPPDHRPLVAMLTALATRRDRERAAAAGADAFIAKPVAVGALLEQIRLLLL